MEEKYRKSLEYIEKYWKEITFYLPKDRGFQIGLPYSFVAPNNALFKNDQFYWDSYFIILGLIESKKIALAKGMIDNFVYLYEKFRIIPARNTFYDIATSQPPFLTSMAMEVFSATQDKLWLKKIAKIAEQELKNYWMNEKGIEKHLVCDGLSRYCDHFVSHFVSEHQSGWDMTSRFNDHCLDYLPIDLNSLLFKYEKDLSEIYKILNDAQKSKKYLEQANKRKKNIFNLMWNNKKGFFFDYNYKTLKQSDFYSIAGFYPLWANLASKTQAEKVKNNLKKFEYKGGIVNTQKNNLSKKFKQWDYPNGWANQQWIVIKGLMNYGYKKDAKKLAQKWLNLNAEVFEKTGKFWEKYDVVKCDKGKTGRYADQTGFGWTNAIFLKLVKESF